MPDKLLPPRVGDEDLDSPPNGVVISIMGLSRGHWSKCIVEDRRPPEVIKASEHITYDVLDPIIENWAEITRFESRLLTMFAAAFISRCPDVNTRFIDYLKDVVESDDAWKKEQVELQAKVDADIATVPV